MQQSIQEKQAEEASVTKQVALKGQSQNMSEEKPQKENEKKNKQIL